MKKCTSCGQDFPIEKYHVADRKSGRRRGDCPACVLRKQKARYADQKEKLAEIRLTGGRKYKYGVTREQVHAMLAEQDNQCKICSIEISYMTAHLDHCHTTSAVRGLLCKNCNWGLGFFKDDPALLSNAISYLQG